MVLFSRCGISYMVVVLGLVEDNQISEQFNKGTENDKRSEEQRRTTMISIMSPVWWGCLVAALVLLGYTIRCLLPVFLVLTDPKCLVHIKRAMRMRPRVVGTIDLGVFIADEERRIGH